MSTNNRAPQLFHGVTLSAVMLFATTSLALADTRVPFRGFPAAAVGRGGAPGAQRCE